ncbi:signal peptidase I [Paenibacillus sp. p3-SID867]|uniref:signal peptidase I n=1 Tax=Paenibacillus sp. p3-SID867 TaxID=2916363 RepID=UPI0021A4EB58|nr:signal peptidase I [Paenibacillus sp. p3-SID867]MCT1403711.1 signal peptidase I [Paenibacillus sp. p3-SID867]
MRIKWYVVIALVLITGCNVQQSTSKISDTETPHYVHPMSNIPEDTILIENLLDEMDQGKFEYDSIEWGEFVVDPHHQEFKRGDVVYLNTPKEKLEKQSSNISETRILRIVGMPGEKIKVNNGQIYIDGLLLDAFYGNARNKGFTQEQYKAWAEENGKDPTRFKEYFTKKFKEISIPSEHYFLIGDNWWRSIDSFSFGTVPREKLIGKVIGYKK